MSALTFANILCPAASQTLLNYYLYALYSIVKLMSISCVTKKYGHNEVLWETVLVYFDKFLTASNPRRARAKDFPHAPPCMLPPPGEAAPPSRPFGRQLPRWGSHGGVAPCPRPAVGEGLAPPALKKPSRAAPSPHASLCRLCRRGRHRAGLGKNGAKMPVRELRTGRLTCY